MGFGAWHSVRHEPDYVSPLYAAFLGATQQFEVTLANLGLPAPLHIADPRIDEHEEPDDDLLASPVVPSGPCLPPLQVNGARSDGQSPAESSLVNGGLHLPKWASGDATQHGESEGQCSVQRSFLVHTLVPCPCQVPAGLATEAHMISTALKPARASTKARKSALRKVRFAFAVQFWFPSPHQVCLHKDCPANGSGTFEDPDHSVPAGTGRVDLLEGCLPSSVGSPRYTLDHSCVAPQAVITNSSADAGTYEQPSILAYQGL